VGGGNKSRKKSENNHKKKNRTTESAFTKLPCVDFWKKNGGAVEGV